MTSGDSAARGPLLVPNVAAEEGATWNSPLGESAVRDAVELWSFLFGNDAELLGSAPAVASLWPDAFGPRNAGAAYAELDDAGAAYAWLHDTQAAAIARERGVRLAAPDPKVVARVHDKAFALAWARQEGGVPADCSTCFHLYAANALSDPEAFIRELETRLASWPPWLRKRFTLKPRFGSSGRGRVAGNASPDAIRGALPRLAERGGALLEPWFDRSVDLSAQFFVDTSGLLRLLGSLELLVNVAGVYRGHRGSIDNKGRVTSLREEDEALRESSAGLVAAAAADGFRGFCGVDAFSYWGEGGAIRFRPAVELNARFTMGTVVLGLLRRALPEIRKAIPKDAGERRAFLFALDAPLGGWPATSKTDGQLLIPLWRPDAERKAGLLVTADAEALPPLVAPSQSGAPPSIIRQH